MADALGSGATFEVSTDSGSNYTALGCVTAIDFSQSVNPVDTTCNDDSGNMTYLGGDFDGTASATYNYDPSAGAQATVQTSFYAKTLLTYRYRPTVGTGLPEFTWTALLTAYPIATAHEETIQVTLDMQISAGVTAGTQA